MENEPIRFVTPRMLDAILQKLVNPMDRAMLLLASEGLRVEDIARLTINDIDIENNIIKIRKNINGKNKIFCLKIDAKTTNECCESYKQQYYLTISKKIKAEIKKLELVNSQYVVRPVCAHKSSSHMTQNSIVYRSQSVLASTNIGLNVCGLESIRIGAILHFLYTGEAHGKEAFDKSIEFVCQKFYNSELKSFRSQLSLINNVVYGLYKKHKPEFEGIIEREDEYIQAITSFNLSKSAVMDEEKPTVKSVTEETIKKFKSKSITFDEAVGNYCSLIEQKVPRSFQSVKKIVDKLTKWSKKNGIAFDKFSHENAISFVVSLKSPNRSEAKRYAEIASNFFKFLYATGNAAQNPFENLDVEEVWEAKNRLKKK